MPEPVKKERKTLSMTLPVERIAQFKQLQREWGLSTHGQAMERLLELLLPDASEQDPEDPSADDQEGEALHERGALVLMPRGESTQLVLTGEDSLTETRLDQSEDPLQVSPGTDETDPVGQRRTRALVGAAGSTPALPPRSGRGSSSGAASSSGLGAGIDLPGFVQQKSARLRQSLHPRPNTPERPSDLVPGISERDLSTALNAATDHWVSLYGTAANEAVLEAAMVWLGQEIWPQSDQAEGRPFTWSALEHWIAECAPSWSAGPPSFERVIVAAGLLEDPFSTATLCVRLPTLIRRFVHRFRRRRQGTSFQTLEHTMTLQGALKVLEIPFVAGERLTLKRIREAYREQAQLHHPDSGGSADTMRRLNEAYQLLKELYRKSG